MCNCNGANESAKAMPSASCGGTSSPCASPPPIGTIKLLKLKFETTYNVCADAVENFGDYKNFFILEADALTEYHWLSERKNADDKTKPANLPITFHSSETLKCTAYFEVEVGKTVPVAPVIKIYDDPNLKFTFDKQTGNTSGTFPLTFTATNLPYDKTINHIPNFELNFKYSIDGEATWLNAGASINELYITWKPFDILSQFEVGSPEQTMQLKCTATGAKFYILETLLHLGCTNAKGKGKNEEEILDAIFSEFEDCKVIRKRDTSGTAMGYWRGESSATPSAAFKATRSLRFLIKNGEARCGEWTTFFNHLAFTQGIDKMGMVPFATTAYTPYISAHPAAAALQNKPFLALGFKPLLLLVKNCSMEPQKDPKTGLPTLTIENFKKSQAQGNDDAVNVFGDHVFSRHENSERFYDASYGKAKSFFPNKGSSTMKNYCSKMLDGVFFSAGGGKHTVYIRHFGGNIDTKVDVKTLHSKDNEYVYLTIARSDVL